MNTSEFKVIGLRDKIEELGKNILQQENAVTNNMKCFFGNKMKYIIFISFCDGKSRANVCKGIGNSIYTAWKNAVDIMNKKVKELNNDPIWIKADLVIDIREYTYEAFIDYVGKIKTNYFREGISFDSMLNTAFLEQEVNANVFINDNEDLTKKLIVWKNVNYYIKNNLGMKYQIEESTVKNIYTFTTIGFFHDSVSCYKLNNEWLNNGRRYIEAIDSELIFSIIEKSSGYLAKQVDDIGKFRYGYFTCFNKEIPKYNVLRHASTTYSMIEAYEVIGDEELKSSIIRALEYLLKEGIELTKKPDGRTKAFVLERTEDNEIKLGANAAAILAFSKYTKVFNDERYIQVMEELAEGINYLQDKKDGSFIHVLNYPDLSIKEKRRIVYYDGEAAFALMRLYDIDKNEQWLNIVEKAFVYFIEKEYWNYKDHWLSYCSYELVKHKPEKKYIEFNLKNANGILNFCLTRETTYPTLLELLMASYNLIQKMKKEELFTETLAVIDYDKLLAAIEHRVEHQLNGFFFPEVAMYYKAPQNILWSFYIRHHSLRVRIDDVEHNVSGYCSYYQNILKK